MFTGIIQGVGKIEKIEKGDRRFRAVITFPEALRSSLKIGTSVSIDGTCLTIREINEQRVSVDISTETVRVTIADIWKVGRVVNLEPSLRVGDDLSGHFVLGHVDGVGVVRMIVRDASEARMTIEPPSDLVRFFPYKGSVAVNGVSLTIANIDQSSHLFIIGVVPYTLQHTNLGVLALGDHVNLEVDMFARYFNHLLGEHLRDFEREKK